MKFEKEIPTKFRKTGEHSLMAHTVGQLDKLLQELPKDLPIETYLGEGVSVSVKVVNWSHLAVYLD